jgi:bifunctional non-homologous end joining protein LigD
MVFDLLLDGKKDYRERPLTERRAALEELLKGRRPDAIRISRQVKGDGRALYDEALAHGWEGLIAKHAASLYKSGKRTPDWRKVKIVHEQEFVIGGWTDPKGTRALLGAVHLGVYEDDDLVYAGRAGSGFDEARLDDLAARLRPLATGRCPFTRGSPPQGREHHWVEPRLVCEVRFTEWTSEGLVRHPVYLGLRADRRARDVRAERIATPRS